MPVADSTGSETFGPPKEEAMSSFDHRTLGSLVAGTAVILGSLGAGLAMAQDKGALIKNALSAAPPGVAETATVNGQQGHPAAACARRTRFEVAGAHQSPCRPTPRPAGLEAPAERVDRANRGTEPR